jgi:hypothetical protein
MVNTYRAVLYGDKIKWIDTPPKRIHPVEVQVTLLGEIALPSPSERGQAMAEALENLARAGTFSAITDPVTWQREARQDRALPGRRL